VKTALQNNQRLFAFQLNVDIVRAKPEEPSAKSTPIKTGQSGPQVPDGTLSSAVLAAPSVGG
jgi:hypothetical protein